LATADSSIDGNIVEQPLVPELVSIHLAEYEALMMRNTYWITLQFALYTVGVIFVAMVLQIPRTVLSKNSVWWLTALGLQAIAATWQQTWFEILDAIKYIEERLRPQVVGLVGRRYFWGFDSYVLTQRNRGFNRFERIVGLVGHIAIAVAAGVGIVLITANTPRPWLARNWAWLVINAFVAVVLCCQGARLGLRANELFRISTSFDSKWTKT
jgi:hypothetical protein